MKQPLRYGSVCSGIEDASVAWEPLGWEPAWFCEIDPFASALLAHRFPGVTNHGDFTRLLDPAHAVHESPPDVLVGGTPCQDFSIAGLRAGIEGDRGSLTLDFCRLVGVLRPEWVVWENVPGVLSSDGGRALGALLGALAELGYGFAYRVLDAQYVRVDGFARAVPQRRRRVFVVGCAGGRGDRAEKVLFEPEGLHGNLAPQRQSRKSAAAFAARRAGACGEPREHRHLPVMSSGQANAEICEDGGAPTLTCLHEAPIAVQAFHPEVAEVCGTLSDGAHHGGGLNGQDAHTGRILPVTYTAPAIGSFTASEVSGTLVRHTSAGSGETQNPAFVQSAMSVRRLTPRECERLQGFPDDWTLIPYRKGESGDGHRYRALGNTMAVNCMRWIGTQIARVDGEGKKE